jgi:predicted ArsR family transcriptional regulator
MSDNNKILKTIDYVLACGPKGATVEELALNSGTSKQGIRSHIELLEESDFMKFNFWKGYKTERRVTGKGGFKRVYLYGEYR